MSPRVDQVLVGWRTNDVSPGWWTLDTLDTGHCVDTLDTLDTADWEPADTADSLS